MEQTYNGHISNREGVFFFGPFLNYYHIFMIVIIYYTAGPLQVELNPIDERHLLIY